MLLILSSSNEKMYSGIDWYITLSNLTCYEINDVRMNKKLEYMLVVIIRLLPELSLTNLTQVYFGIKSAESI